MIKFHESCQVARRSMKRFNGEIPISICTIRGYGSDVANTLYETGEEVLILTQKFYNGDYGMSLRTRRQDIDLAKVAEAFGGGGHRQAAGAKLTPEDIKGEQDFIHSKVETVCLRLRE